MQTYDAYKAIVAGKYAAGGIALGIAIVQLPDVMGWLFGEIMKIGFVIAAIDWLNEKFTVIQHSVEIKCEKSAPASDSIMYNDSERASDSSPSTRRDDH